MKYKTVGTCLFFFLLLLVNGCSGFTKRVGNNTTSSSLTDFLYPNNQQRIAQSNQIPQINLPTSIGIAFLPSRNWHNNSFDTNTEYQLLEKVKKRFTPYPFIERIKIIPSTYLRHDSLKGSSGFDTLNQVARLHNVDLIALVSYDQLTQSKQNNASLFYWTIVGMYVIPGNENTIQTFVDTAIFDVKSRKLLMRTPGVNKLDKLSTLVEVDRVSQIESNKGFNLAFDDMIENLDKELTRFKTLVKDGKTVQIKNAENYSGAGSFNVWWLLVFSSILIFRGLDR